MDVAWIIFLFAVGACVGSFLNVVIYRLPRGESIVFPGSHCPSCGRAIKWYDNIPLVSWIALCAKCRFCKARISPRYILIELATAILVAGLYVCYYILHLRQGAGTFEQTWPMFLAHAALLCGLLACTAIDIECWIVPLEVCWLISLVGIICATADPSAYHSQKPFAWLPEVSPLWGAMSLSAGIGLIIALLLQKYGIFQQSFLDATDKPISKTSQTEEPDAKPTSGKPAISVAITSEHGVNPRVEVIREVVFLSPAIILAAAAYLLVTHVPAIQTWWSNFFHSGMGGGAGLARHLNGFLAALMGYLLSGLLVWMTRILGTLAFGKEAMGLGDVHLMAAVGAVAGWIVPILAFFVAPVFGLLWALYLLLGRNQRELPYGPWLAVGTVIVMLFYDRFFTFIQAYQRLMSY